MSKKDKKVTLYDIYAVVTRNDRSLTFWEENPDLLKFSPYKEFAEDKGLEDSALIMDGIWHVYDGKSKARQKTKNRPAEVRQLKEQTGEVLFNDPDYDWEQHKSIIDAYKKDTTSELESNVEFYAKKLREYKITIDKLNMKSDTSTVGGLMKEFHELTKHQAEHQSILDEDRRSTNLKKGIVLHRVERIDMDI